MARFGIAALLLLAFAGAVASARPLDEPAVNAGAWAHDVVNALNEWSNGRMQVETGAVQASNDKPSQFNRFYLLVKYIAKPHLQKEFVEEALKVRDEAEKQDGAIRFQLSKTITDNLLWYNYQEWESKEDFIAYIKKEDSEVKRLAEYITEKDIAFTLTELKPAVPYHKPDHKESSEKTSSNAMSSSMRVMTDLLEDATEGFQDFLQPQAASHAVAAGDKQPKGALLIKYLVRPSAARDFIKAVHVVTKKVAEEEEGNEVYGLSKTLTDDTTFYSYAVWDSKEAVEKHLKSEYAQELKHFIIENDIVLTTTVLIPIDAPPA